MESHVKPIKPYQMPANAAALLADCDPAEVAAAHAGWETKNRLGDQDFLTQFPNPTAFASAVLLGKKK
jgi:hypothetical protein